MPTYSRIKNKHMIILPPPPQSFDSIRLICDPLISNPDIVTANIKQFNTQGDLVSDKLVFFDSTENTQIVPVGSNFSQILNLNMEGNSPSSDYDLVVDFVNSTN